MNRTLILLYGIVAYAIGLGGLVFFMMFIGGCELLPRHIDSSSPGPLTSALLINMGLIILFGVQHTVMARSGFKTAWTKLIPPASERSTYVLLSGLILGLIGLCWQPIEGTLWHVENRSARMILIAIEVLGWVLVVVSSFVINHFELFGLQQVYRHFADKGEPPAVFTDRFLYRIVRHPLQLGVLIGIWVTPTMSMTHFMLSATMTVYIFIGLYYEEADLVELLGDDYSAYRGRVPMILPIPKRLSKTQ